MTDDSGIPEGWDTECPNLNPRTGKCCCCCWGMHHDGWCG